MPISLEIKNNDMDQTYRFLIYSVKNKDDAKDLAQILTNELVLAGITCNDIVSFTDAVAVNIPKMANLVEIIKVLQKVIQRLSSEEPGGQFSEEYQYLEDNQKNNVLKEETLKFYTRLKSKGVTASYAASSTTADTHFEPDDTPLAASQAAIRLDGPENRTSESNDELSDEEDHQTNRNARTTPLAITPQKKAAIRLNGQTPTPPITPTTPTPPPPPPITPRPPISAPTTTPIPAYPYAHGSTVLRAITAARAGHMGDFYGSPETFATWSQHTTMMNDVKNDFLPSLANFVAEANDLVNMVAADPAQGAQILDRAVGELDAERNKGKSVNQILESIDQNLLKTLDSKFRESQHGIGYTTPINANISAAYESHSTPLARMNDLGLTDARRQKLIALFEASILFAGTKFEHKPDGSFTLYANVNGTMTPILEGSMNNASYRIKTVKGMPQSERARAIVAMSYITMQFRQKNNNNSTKLKMQPNANPLEVILQASELICRGKMRVDLTEVSPYVISKLNSSTDPNKQELLNVWNELLYASTMRSHRNPDVIENWPHALIKDFDLRSMLSPHQSIDTALARLGSRVEKLASIPQPALAASAAPGPTFPALPPIPGGAPALPPTRHSIS